jgi:hypothetical protein
MAVHRRKAFEMVFVTIKMPGAVFKSQIPKDKCQINFNIQILKFQTHVALPQNWNPTEMLVGRRPFGGLESHRK